MFCESQNFLEFFFSLFGNQFKKKQENMPKGSKKSSKGKKRSPVRKPSPTKRVPVRKPSPGKKGSKGKKVKEDMRQLTGPEQKAVKKLTLAIQTGALDPKKAARQASRAIRKAAKSKKSGKKSSKKKTPEKREPSAYQLFVKQYMKDHMGMEPVPQLMKDAAVQWNAEKPKAKKGREVAEWEVE